ncbi:MAG: GGDEF domain-containing protein [Eggerthellales bacterium]|nr:GGDEF domain-containing protein [Eggerthellales bacterium]
MAFDALTTVYIANGIGIVLMLTLVFSNRHRLNDDKGAALIYALMGVCLLACVCDPIAYYIDGKPGFLVTVLIYLTNSYLFLANIATGSLWVFFITEHLGIPFSDTRKKVYGALVGLGITALLLNPFYPLVFSAENNVYKRGPFFWVFLCIAIVYLADSLLLYLKRRDKVGVLRFFPVHVFILPVCLGTTIQCCFYGLSLIGVSVAVGIAGVMTALKSEAIYTDRLTGLYNRTYLDYMQQQIRKNQDPVVSGVMIDLNSFKKINDTLGHSVGDQALQDAARILSRVFGEYGVVMRYAGDEFVALLNTADENLVEDVIAKAYQALQQFNDSGMRPYQLSAAMGHAVLDLGRESMNDFMNNIDRAMYKNKMEYYASRDNDSRTR